MSPPKKKTKTPEHMLCFRAIIGYGTWLTVLALYLGKTENWLIKFNKI